MRTGDENQPCPGQSFTTHGLTATLRFFLCLRRLLLFEFPSLPPFLFLSKCLLLLLHRLPRPLAGVLTWTIPPSAAVNSRSRLDSTSVACRRSPELPEDGRWPPELSDDDVGFFVACVGLLGRLLEDPEPEPEVEHAVTSHNCHSWVFFVV